MEVDRRYTLRLKCTDSHQLCAIGLGSVGKGSECNTSATTTTTTTPVSENITIPEQLGTLGLLFLSKYGW